MKVRDMMTTEVATADPETTLEEIATLMRDEDTGAIPVLEDGELAGMITDRDIVLRCIAEGKNPSEITAKEVMSTDVETIEADAAVEEASRQMSRSQIRRLAVMDGGRFAGMLSLGDVSVKEQDRKKDPAGSALKEISRGVKHENKAQPSARESGTSEQGIANQSLQEEQKRQSRVIPFREQGKRTPRRKTG